MTTCRPFIASLCLASVASTASHAAVIVFDGGTTGTGTDYNTGTNWNPDNRPGSSDDGYIGGTFDVVLSATLPNTQGAKPNVLTIDNATASSSADASLTIDGGGLFANQVSLASVNAGTSAELTLQNGGTLEVGGNSAARYVSIGAIGAENNTTSVLSVADDSVLTTRRLAVGASNITSATVNVLGADAQLNLRQIEANEKSSFVFDFDGDSALGLIAVTPDGTGAAFDSSIDSTAELVVDFSNFGGAADGSYTETLIDFDGTTVINGTFTTSVINTDSTITNATITFDADDKDYVLSYTVVPEPATFGLLSFGMGVLMVYRNRRVEN
jgi:hypothetical protein